MMPARRTMLILSFSPIAGDARVLKQIARFTHDFDVTTLGYGTAPDGVVEHISMPAQVRYDDLDGRLITLHLYRAAYWAISAVRWARAVLAGHEFDVIIANDVETVPVALGLKPRYGVLADLHEYSPRLHDDNAAWARRISPWFDWVVRRYVTRARAWTTVSEGIIREYERNFGFQAALVTNAAPYHELVPTANSGPIRLVHSGACLRNRHLDVMIEAVLTADADVTLDLYLTPNDPPYLEELRNQAERSDRIVVHEPVPYANLIPLLNQYDLGVHLLPPVNFNNTWALPNKIFDFLQARLGVLIGPSPEMAAYVTRYGFGTVIDGFTTEDARAAIEGITRENVDSFKQQAHAHAYELAGERQAEVWERIVVGMTTEAPR